MKVTLEIENMRVCCSKDACPKDDPLNTIRVFMDIIVKADGVTLKKFNKVLLSEIDSLSIDMPIDLKIIDVY